MDLSMVSKLRKATQAGVADCKSALEESGGDYEKAIEILRKKGEAKADKKLDTRESKEGIVHAYIHSNGKIGSMIQLNSETDFVARNQEFKDLAHDLAMHIAALQPKYRARNEVPAEEIEKEKEIYLEQLKNEGKKEEIMKRIIEGKLEKYYEEVCLMDQRFIKDEDLTIENLIKNKISTLGEKIELVRFIFFQV